RNMGVFEIGSIYYNDNHKPDQYTYFSGAVLDDYEYVKQQLGVILHRLHLDMQNVHFKPTDTHDAAVSSAYIYYKDHELGIFNAQEYGSYPLCSFEIDASDLAKYANLSPV